MVDRGFGLWFLSFFLFSDFLHSLSGFVTLVDFVVSFFCTTGQYRPR
jgi:hypothetical protein